MWMWVYEYVCGCGCMSMCVGVGVGVGVCARVSRQWLPLPNMSGLDSFSVYLSFLHIIF